ncbi:MAG TPA: helix-turn-helix domain-containing protein [Leptolyngbyaceae cyanobacterium M33_DOE_097]|uniref:CdaR family transcriptional regulator n=1 Tax=Oscillatoriales cyanobacterium SpSt-418 TaxID=2282169 RepID=A0A7C3PE32_9CYAN|nr:helix-turn-helix domain-containing protein [Leptolyngbyaceae cyanobacterium M33_DOE_097]
MLDVSASFIQISRVITDKVSQLLYAPVFVVNQQGLVVTSSYPYCDETDYKLEDCKNSLKSFLRVPFCHALESGEIVVGESFNQEPVSPRLAQALVELVLDQIANHQGSSINQNELKDHLIADLLHGQIKDEALILSQARQLGMDLTPPRAVILINASEYVLKNTESSQKVSEAEQKRRTQLIIRSIVNFFHLPNDTICSDLGQGDVCVLKASDAKNLDPWVECSDVARGASSSWANLTALKRAADALLLRLRSDTQSSIDIGIGRYHAGVSGLARSYEDARAALSLGSRFLGHNRVHCLGELGIAAFIGVADESTKVDLAKYLLSPLDLEPELMTTLETFFKENCCPSLTAKRLSVHRNTLSYRLDKIASLTGLDPRIFDAAVQMRLCLLLRSLQSSQLILA